MFWIPKITLRGNTAIPQRMALRSPSLVRTAVTFALTRLSLLDHILNADESPTRGITQHSRNQHIRVTYLKEILKFVRKFMQAGAVICDGFSGFLKFFA